eukprot:4678493-Pyramimonas_sp.AAC.1
METLIRRLETERLNGEAIAQVHVPQQTLAQLSCLLMFAPTTLQRVDQFLKTGLASGVGMQILMRLPAPETISEATRDQRLAELCDAFAAVVFDPDMVSRHGSVSPFMELLNAIPDYYSSKLRERLVKDAMKQLTVPRPLDAKRTDFFLHAEVFANLVQLKFVTTSAMAKT